MIESHQPDRQRWARRIRNGNTTGPFPSGNSTIAIASGATITAAGGGGGIGGGYFSGSAQNGNAGSDGFCSIIIYNV